MSFQRRDRMNLFEARARRRKTQWDIRQNTGIHQSKVSLIERGYVEPTEKEKTLIAKALGFAVSEIKWPKQEANKFAATQTTHQTQQTGPANSGR